MKTCKECNCMRTTVFPVMYSETVGICEKCLAQLDEDEQRKKALFFNLPGQNEPYKM